MKLSKAIIKQYGISKKAWAVARGKSRSNKTEVSNMARKRRSKKSGFARYAKRGGFGNASALLQVDAMLYGAVREKTSNMIAPLTAKAPIPMGLADEVGMGLLCWGVAKYAGKGMLGNVARKGLVIENARVGEAIAQGALGSMTATSSNGVVYL